MVVPDPFLRVEGTVVIVGSTTMALSTRIQDRREIYATEKGNQHK